MLPFQLCGLEIFYIDSWHMYEKHTTGINWVTCGKCMSRPILSSCHGETISPATLLNSFVIFNHFSAFQQNHFRLFLKLRQVGFFSNLLWEMPLIFQPIFLLFSQSFLFMHLQWWTDLCSILLSEVDTSVGSILSVSFKGHRHHTVNDVSSKLLFLVKYSATNVWPFSRCKQSSVF